jgi:ABC-type antimicrobial peptide transport system permease subunit
MALGALPNNILGLVVGQGMKLAVAGVAAGLLGAFALTRVMESLLFGVHAGDAVTFLSAAVLLGVVTLAASYVPARRASRVNPITALRED